MIYNILKIGCQTSNERKALTTILSDPDIVMSYCYVPEMNLKSGFIDYGLKFSVWLTKEQTKKYRDIYKRYFDDCYDYDEIPERLAQCQEQIKTDIKRILDIDAELREIAERYVRK